jgi:3alpha(or 20beta)-hydroxysteroid dehydrogenase
VIAGSDQCHLIAVRFQPLGALRDDVIVVVATLELGPHGIRVNSIHPGGIDTPMGNPGSVSSETLDRFYTLQAIPRVGQPVEVAWMAVFLASDEASYCSGSEYPVDGGWNAGARNPLLPGGTLP